jgi:hypothetical protein
VCLSGARWVRENVIDRHPGAKLSIYVVWMPMLATDARDEIDVALLQDDRVRQFWDEKRMLGRYLAEADLGGLGYSGIVWDAFFLFGPQARWTDRPTGLVESGAPVVNETDKLESALGAFVK